MSRLIGDCDSTVDDLIIMLSSQEVSAPNRRPQVTKVISVPTSEHVAQIVGKSGSKIKNLRSATQTCIKTPLRGDEPVFSVSGTEVNVDKVLTIIKHASDHFTRLMESRSNACAVGEVTVLVPVPQQYVGVVVGRNGQVIMRIKEQTRTRINTPKGDTMTPAFEVTGTQINVMAAKEAIEDKVRQALLLKDSTAYDPDLCHKTKSLNEAINWPPNRQSFMSQASNNSGYFNQNNNNKSQLTSIGWPTTASFIQSRASSPHFHTSFNHLQSNTISSFLDPDHAFLDNNSFQF